MSALFAVSGAGALTGSMDWSVPTIATNRRTRMPDWKRLGVSIVESLISVAIFGGVDWLLLTHLEIFTIVLVIGILICGTLVFYEGVW